MILVRSVEGRRARSSASRISCTYVAVAGVRQFGLEHADVRVLTTLVTVPLAFVFAYAIQRSCIPFKGLWRNIALIPILAPSLLAALSFIYLFGNQGVLKVVLGWFGLTTIYGMPGMVLAMTFSAFPHAVMILLAALVAVRCAAVRGGRFARHDASGANS